MAGISYTLDQPRASPGQTVHITAVMFNDGDSTIDWTPPESLVLQWRSSDGQVTRSLATLDGTAAQINTPVNTFAKVRWQAVVPSQLDGLQAVNIEGETTLMALDTTPEGRPSVLANATNIPVVDAGTASSPDLPDPPLPDNVVIASGASPTDGPGIARPRTYDDPTASPASLSGFDKFRNAISPYEPVYFVLGNRGGRNARYQVSFKYRVFTPKDINNPSFFDHLYIGYTQTALWDLHSDSHPFIDTSYKPSLFWHKDALLQSSDKQWFMGLASGVEHESNGKAGNDSRSINYAYIQPELNYRFNNGSTLTFAPRVKSYFRIGDNPDYRDYAGNVDWKLRWAQDNGLVLSGMYRHGRKSRDTTQLDAAWPLRRTPLNMNGYVHFQYFKGYGETLLGYSQKSGSQFRLGFSFIP